MSVSCTGKSITPLYPVLIKHHSFSYLAPSLQSSSSSSSQVIVITNVIIYI
jgi:hypothetical protein